MVRGNMFFQSWTWLASFGILAMIQKSISRDYRDIVMFTIDTWVNKILPYSFCDIHEYDGSTANKLYQDVKAYIASLKLDANQRVTISRRRSGIKPTFSLARDQHTNDTFAQAKVQWVHRVTETSHGTHSYVEKDRKFTLRVSKRDKERMLDAYLAYIESRVFELKRASGELSLFTNSKSVFSSRSSTWDAVPFAHPATFDTIALDGDLKSRILTDLENFAASENFYRKVGKTWKRGYLLFGPPGTGKSSVIAAIANKLRYDVYDLELTEVKSNADLRRLLLNTSHKSVVVIEDIDCSLNLSAQRVKEEKKTEKEDPPPKSGTSAKSKEKESQVTLSGLLNFVDGLWSCCGSERIFVFTTNHLEKLDPALSRPGRMDMHISLSYCTFSAFKVLAKNYLDVIDHERFRDVEHAFKGSFMTPADVIEVLIRHQNDSVELALDSVIKALGEHREDPARRAPRGSDDAKIKMATSSEADMEGSDGSNTKNPHDTPVAAKGSENKLIRRSVEKVPTIDKAEITFKENLRNGESAIWLTVNADISTNPSSDEALKQVHPCFPTTAIQDATTPCHTIAKDKTV